MPLDAFSPQPSLASTHAPESAATTATHPGGLRLTSEMWVSTKLRPSSKTPPPSSPASATSPPTHLLLLISLWLLLYITAAFTPPLLDDADATHALAAQSMLSTGDWVTLHVNGIRYLEKPPLPYWITAVSLKLFAPTSSHRPQSKLPPSAQDSVRASADGWDTAAFAVHFPLALTVLVLVLLGYTWARRAFNQTAAFYTGLFLLTSAGVFLFTRIFIPDALLSLLLAFTLYAFLRSLNSQQTNPSPSAQDSVILSEARSNQNAVILSEARSAQPKDLDALHPAAFLAPIPPTKPPPSSHLLWPYAMWTALALAVLTKGLVAIVFIVATTLVFLLYTRQLHLWRCLRPFTGLLLFLAIAAPWHILAGLRNTGAADGHGFFWFYFVNEHVLRFLGRRIPRDYNKLPSYLYWSLHLVWLFPWSLFLPAALITAYRNRRTVFSRTTITFRHQTVLLLFLFSTLVLAFFSLSTNQEYYTFPVYLPFLMLLAATLTTIERSPLDPTLRRALTLTFATYTTLGVAIAAALAYGLWSSRHLSFLPDIGELLAHRNVGDYTLSMSHFFDLTGPSFAALRLPAVLALIAFLTGPALSWLLYARLRILPAILSIAATSSVFLLAAHIAFVRFNPMLSSVNFAETIQALERTHQISPKNIVLIYDDQAFGSSIPFYLDRQVELVDGRTTSMLFGSTFPDAPHLFLTSADLLAQWGTGPRKLLFVPLEQRENVDHLLGSRQIILQQTSGKALITDRPLNSTSTIQPMNTVISTEARRP